MFVVVTLGYGVFMIHRQRPSFELLGRRGLLVSLLWVMAVGCGKKDEEAVTVSPEVAVQATTNESRGAPVAQPLQNAASEEQAPRPVAASAAKPVVIAADQDMEARLKQLTRELRRWVVRHQRKPSSYEEFASSAGFEAPDPPPGKKYAVSREMKVVLVNR